MITGSRGGLTYNPNHLGIMKIAKNRRGEEGIEAPYIRLNNGRFRILPQSIYVKLKGLSEKRDFTDGDIDQMIEAEMSMRQAQSNMNMSAPSNNVGGPAPAQSKKGPTKPVDPNYNPLAAYFNQNTPQP